MRYEMSRPKGNASLLRHTNMYMNIYT